MNRLTLNDYKAIYDLKARGLTPEQIAEKTKLHVKTVGIYCRPDYSPWLEAKALNKPVPLSPRQAYRKKAEARAKQLEAPLKTRRRLARTETTELPAALFALLTPEHQALLKKKMLTMLLSYEG